MSTGGCRGNWLHIEKHKSDCLDSDGILMYKRVCYLTLVIHAVRHRDEAAAKFDAGKEFSLPEQIGREFAKLTGQ